MVVCSHALIERRLLPAGLWAGSEESAQVILGWRLQGKALVERCGYAGMVGGGDADFVSEGVG